MFSTVEALITVLWLSCLFGSSEGNSCIGKNISHLEFQGLQHLFVSTNGSSWIWNPFLPVTSHWHFPNSTNTSTLLISKYLHLPCGNEWQGLQCSPSSSSSNLCVIQNMTLVNMNLLGNLPSELVLCSNLQVSLRFSFPCAVVSLF